jgi:hypothetical protein
MTMEWTVDGVSTTPKQEVVASYDNISNRLFKIIASARLLAPESPSWLPLRLESVHLQNMHRATKQQ